MMRSSVLSALLIACHLSLLVPSGRAQQATRPGSASNARRGYFARVQTDSAVSSPATRDSRPRLRLDLTREVDGRGSVAATDGSLMAVPDPLRPHSSAGRAGTITRPYERAPVVSPPERVAPAPAASHNYYPTLRSGQSVNRNLGSVGTRGHVCVPGRGAFLNR